MKEDGGAAAEARAGVLPDSERLELVSESIENGLESMLGALGQPLFDFCTAVVGTQRVQSLMTRTITRVAETIPAGLGGQALKPWLMAQAERVAESGPELTTQPAETLAPGSAESARFEELSTTERKALVMHETGGLTYGEIADVLGISSVAARQAVSDARLAMTATVPGPTAECEVVRKAIVQDSLPPLAQRAVDRHLERCPHCSKVQSEVAALPGVLREMLPKLTPILISFLLREGLARASVGGPDEPDDDSGADEDKSSSDAAYRRRRSIAAGAVLALLVIVSALAVLTGRLADSSRPGTAVLLPTAFIDLGDLAPDGPTDCVGADCDEDDGPTDCLAGSAGCPDLCPDGVAIRPDCGGDETCPPGSTDPRCRTEPPPVCPPNCPPLCPPNCPPPPPPVCPDGTIEPDCERPNRCPDGTVEPDCERPNRCPDGTVEPDCKRPPPRCADGTVEPDCTPPERCPDGTVTPDCTPVERCPDGTVEPDCTPVERCPIGTVEPDCHLPPKPCPAGTIEPDCHLPPPVCPAGTVAPDCHPQPGPVCPPGTHPHRHRHGCVPDFEPLPDLCDRHRHRRGQGHEHHHGHGYGHECGGRSHHEPATEPEPDPEDAEAPPNQEEAPVIASAPEPVVEPEQEEQPPAAVEEDSEPAEDVAPPPAEPQPPIEPAPPAEPAPPVEQPAPVEPEPVEPEPEQPEENDDPPDHDQSALQAQWAVTPQRRTSRRRWALT